MSVCSCKKISAVGARAFVSYVEERCFGYENADQDTLATTTPTWLGRMKRVEITSESVVTEISTLSSEALSPQRAVLKRVQGQFGVGGDVNAELSNDGFVYLITQAIGRIIVCDSTAVILPVASDGITSDCTAIAVQNSVASDYVSDGEITYEATCSDSAGYQYETGYYTVDPYALEPGMTFIIGRDAGTIKDTTGTDPTSGYVYFKYTGMKVNSWAVTAAPDAIVTTTFGMLGKEEAIKDWATPSYAEGSNDPFTGFNGTVTLYDDAYDDSGTQTTVTACVLSFDMTLSNDMSTDRYCLGEKYRNSLPEQSRTIEGTISIELADLVLYNKFLNGTAAALKIDFDLNDNDNETLAILLPHIEFNGTTPSNAGPEAITQELPYTALWESEAKYMLSNSDLQPFANEGFDVAVEVASASAGAAFPTTVV